MQISAAITEKYKSIYGLVNIPDHATKMVSLPMFHVNKDDKTMLGVIWCVAVKKYAN